MSEFGGRDKYTRAIPVSATSDQGRVLIDAISSWSDACGLKIQSGGSVEDYIGVGRHCSDADISREWTRNVVSRRKWPSGGVDGFVASLTEDFRRRLSDLWSAIWSSLALAIRWERRQRDLVDDYWRPTDDEKRRLSAAWSTAVGVRRSRT